MEDVDSAPVAAEQMYIVLEKEHDEERVVAVDKQSSGTNLLPVNAAAANSSGAYQLLPNIKQTFPKAAGRLGGEWCACWSRLLSR